MISGGADQKCVRQKRERNLVQEVESKEGGEAHTGANAEGAVAAVLRRQVELKIPTAAMIQAAWRQLGDAAVTPPVDNPPAPEQSATNQPTPVPTPAPNPKPRAQISHADKLRRAKILRDHDNSRCSCAKVGMLAPGDAGFVDHSMFCQIYGCYAYEVGCCDPDIRRRAPDHKCEEACNLPCYCLEPAFPWPYCPASRRERFRPSVIGHPDMLLSEWRAAQVGRGPVAEAVAHHLAVQAERNETARVAAQAERDRCSATARLLASAGWHERAAAAMAAAPNPTRVAAPLLPASDGVISLRPTAIRSKAPSAISPGQEAAVGAWRGSLVAASSLRPPPAGATLTPVHSEYLRRSTRWMRI